MRKTCLIRKIEPLIYYQGKSYLRSEILGTRSGYFTLRLLSEIYPTSAHETKIKNTLMNVAKISSFDLELLESAHSIRRFNGYYLIQESGRRYLSYLKLINQKLRPFIEPIYGSDTDIFERFLRELKREMRLKYLDKVLLVSPWIYTRNAVNRLIKLIKPWHVDLKVVTREESKWYPELHDKCKRELRKANADIIFINNRHAKAYAGITRLTNKEKSIAIITSANLTGYKLLEVGIVLTGYNLDSLEIILNLEDNILRAG